MKIFDWLRKLLSRTLTPEQEFDNLMSKAELRVVGSSSSNHYTLATKLPDGQSAIIELLRLQYIGNSLYISSITLYDPKDQFICVLGVEFNFPKTLAVAVRAVSKYHYNQRTEKEKRDQDKLNRALTYLRKDST